MKNTCLATGVMMMSMCAFGCSEQHAHVDEEGCEHLKEGPAVALTAGATPEAATTIAADHRRYDVTLIDVAGASGGYVKYAAPEATDYLFFFGANVGVSFLDAANSAVTPEASATSSTACAEIKGRHLVPLEVGTYTLKLAATTPGSVSIVVEEADHAPH